MTLFHSLPRITTQLGYNPSNAYRSQPQPYSSSSPSSARSTVLNAPYYSASTASPSSATLPFPSPISRVPTTPMSSKRGKEEVWPYPVERAFMEAITEIPKLGRRKVPLHEKHYGRNELIAAYIYRDTKQSRSRKQVSSHIQVLKNTRKEDLVLMELLSDGSPDESNDPAWLEAAMTKIRKIFGDDRLQESLSFSPISPTSPSDNILLHREEQHHQYHQQPLFSKDKKRRRMHSHDDSEEDCIDERGPQHSRQLSIASILNPEPGQSRNRDQNQHTATTGVSGFIPAEGSESGELYSAGYLKEERMATATSARRSSHGLVWQGKQHRNSAQYMETSLREPASLSPSIAGRYSITTVERSPVHPLSDGEGSGAGYDPAQSYLSKRHAFWPCYFKLVMEESRLDNTYALPLLTKFESVLVEHSAPFHDGLQSEDIRVLDEMRFPHVTESFASKRCLFIRCKMGLNLEGASQQARLRSRSQFQSREPLTIRCDTTVYSFGKEVVGSEETKQATYYRDRLVYDFGIVDAWLEEFLHTLRDGGNEEMESSLQNMTIVQEFSSLVAGPDGPEGEPRSKPLLVVAYEFSAGHGYLNTYRLTSGPPPASVRARSHTWDHPTSPWTPRHHVARPRTAPNTTANTTSTSDGNSSDNANSNDNHNNYRRMHRRPSLEFEQEWPPQSKKYRRELQPTFTLT